MEHLPTRRFRHLPALVAAIAILAVTMFQIPATQIEGMFARIEMSRGGETLGEFTCELEFERTPLTVANFVGLAEGSLSWIDFSDGSIADRPFYDGIAVHRVDAGFVIQAGSPNGIGNDGAGFTFADEIVDELRHDKAGVLSMANSGANSNESQFFITLNAQPSLDGLHTVFGEVMEGMDVVNAVQVGDVIERVTIIRNGPVAKTFDPDEHGLPTVRPLTTSLQIMDQRAHLSFDAPGSEILTFASIDLETWVRNPATTFSTSVETVASIDVTPSQPVPNAFFKQIAVDYTHEILTPANVTGHRLSLADSTGVTFALSFTDGSTGTYTLDTGAQILGPFPINDYQWVQEAHRGRAIGNVFNLDGLTLNGLIIAEADVSLIFTSPTAGTFQGRLVAEATPPRLIPINGSFSLDPL